MILIDKAALRKRLLQIMGTQPDKHMKNLFCIEAHVIDKMPEVDAIPIEWMKERLEQVATQAEPHFAFGYVLAEWQREKDKWQST